MNTLPADLITMHGEILEAMSATERQHYALAYADFADALERAEDDDARRHEIRKLQRVWTRIKKLQEN